MSDQTHQLLKVLAEIILTFVHELDAIPAITRSDTSLFVLAPTIKPQVGIGLTVVFGETVTIWVEDTTTHDRTTVSSVSENYLLYSDSPHISQKFQDPTQIKMTLITRILNLTNATIPIVGHPR